jgi:protein O-mannosyl-transferase
MAVKMLIHPGSARREGIFTPALFLCLLVAFAYGNSFHASWHFDDYDNITQNSRIRIHDLSLKSLWDAALPPSEFKGRFQRPVSRLSFALNWYFGKESVVGYHVVNSAIHLTTSFILYLTMLRLLRSPNVGSGYPRDGHPAIALPAAALWAVHPIQIQAVTYVVQRMTSLAAMFCVLAIYLFLVGRSQTSGFHRAFSYGGCLLAFVLAIGAKENAFMLPLSLFLVEIVFFRDGRDPSVKRSFAFAFLIAGLLALLGSLAFSWADLSSHFKHYDLRPFTPFQRLLTQPRILLLYLSQILFPLPSRFSVVHDIDPSVSLLEPPTTALAGLGILILAFVSIKNIRKWPLLAFSILFFLLNHLPESSILPLELVFEHRNYLPSLFLFLPLAAAAFRVLARYRGSSRAVPLLMVTALAALLVALGTSTHWRNRDWRTERSLWEDATSKAPLSARPYHNLAWAYYHRNGMFPGALRYYEMSLNAPLVENLAGRAYTLTNMASIYSTTGDYEKALTLSRRAIDILPKRRAGYVPLIRALDKLGRQEEMKRYVQIFNTLSEKENSAGINR